MTKPAPESVPIEAASYLDKAAERLSALVKEHGLALRPYDQYDPGQTSWLHALYGKANDREFCVQVITDARLAAESRGHVHGWVRLYPRNGKNEWLHLLANHPVAEIDDLVSQAVEAVRLMRIVCVLSMPHPTDPDPKA